MLHGFPCKLFALLLAIVFFSCRKTDLEPTPNFNSKNGACLLTSYSDDVQALEYHFTYNAKGDPITSTTTKMTYGTRNRLIKADYSYDGFSYFREFLYKDQAVLPEVSKLYLQGNLISTDRYSYASGKLVKVETSLNTATNQEEIVLRFSYDGVGNLTTVMKEGQQEPLYKGIKYDNKPNAFGTNPWIKYVLFSLESGLFIDRFLLFNTNNATEWNVNEVAGSPGIAATATYLYGEKEYPVKRTALYKVPDFGELTGTTTLGFDCGARYK